MVVLVAAAGLLLAYVLSRDGGSGPPGGRPPAAGPLRAVGGRDIRISPQFFGQHLMSNSRLSPAIPIHAMRLWDSNTRWCQMDNGTASHQYNFRQLHLLLAHASRLDADVEFTFGDTPHWAAIGARPQSSVVDQCSSGSNTAAPVNESYWTDFVTAVVSRFKGKIHAYELWNEADATAFWSGGVGAMVHMSVDAAAIIHRIDPSALVLSPSVTDTPQGYAFLRQYLSRLPPGTIDAIAVHSYPFGARPERAVPAEMNAVRSVLPPTYAHIPIWSTEGGWGLTSQFSKAPADQRAFVARYDLLMLAQGFTRSYWYAYANTQWGGLWNGTALTPAGIATRTLNDWLTGAVLAGCATNGNLWTCDLTTGAGQPARIVWVTKTPVHNYPTARYRTVKTLNGGASSTGGSPITATAEPVLLSP